MSGNADSFTALFTPDGKFIVPGKQWSGLAEIRAAFTSFSEQHSDVKIEIRRIIVEDDQAVVEWTWEDTEVVTQQHNKAEDLIAIDFSSGKIYRWREYIDTKILF